MMAFRSHPYSDRKLKFPSDNSLFEADSSQCLFYRYWEKKGTMPMKLLKILSNFLFFLCKKVVLGFLCSELEEIISSFLDAFDQSVGNDQSSSSSSRKPRLDLNSTTAAENSYFFRRASRVEELERKMERIPRRDQERNRGGKKEFGF
ncbi:hypothetical protein ACH5RR_018397 [Cinchona calisaya]|uniref:Uncharacterized protein n=1 Tax=Cinchona calisaya TaxID=153742 RepID=A0ABD2ZRF8_9GENT